MLLDNILCEENILERVDAYSIYSFYIDAELELGRPYNSPLRSDDENPSFELRMWENNVIGFKDYTLDLKGNVFKFVKELFQYETINDALSRINIDYELGLIGGNNTIEGSKVKGSLVNGFKARPKLKDIRVHSIKPHTTDFLDFYGQYGIQSTVLDMYFATQVDTVVYYYENKKTVMYPKEFTIAYRINCKYKIYSPNTHGRYRFTNNYGHHYIEGYLQLKRKNNFLIITKSMKEVMFFRQHFDWDAIAGKSETSYITREMMLKLVKDYDYIFVWLDNDVAGQRAQAKYQEYYPFLIPLYYDVPQKDPTDRYAEVEDKQSVLTEIQELIKNGSYKQSTQHNPSKYST